MATLALSGSAIISAGANVSSSVPSESWDDWIEQAEAYLCNLVKYDLVTNWTSLNAVYKLLFEEFCERYAAVEGIKYNMAAYTTRYEAQSMIAVHLARMNAIEELLDEDTQNFAGV